MQAIVDFIDTCSSIRPWIFIIDNVDENHPAAQEVVTALLRLSNVKTFVTSRLRNIFGGSARIVEVKPLSNENAQSFVHTSLPTQQSRSVQDLFETTESSPSLEPGSGLHNK
jgi:hypothetical protein